MSCPDCEPWAEGELHWVNGRGPTDLRDLVTFTVQVPEDLCEHVMTLVRCPSCGSDVDGWGEVGTEWPHEAAHREAVETAHRRWEKKLNDFAALLAKTPTLGATHAVGKRLLRELRKLTPVAVADSVWYRARNDIGRAFTVDEMRVPDPVATPIPIGRWNHVGQAHWYLADDPDGALAEVLPPDELTGWVQAWRVGAIGGVLDLLSFGADDPSPVSLVDVRSLPLVAVALIFGGYFTRPAHGHWKPEYLVPQFVMDAAKNAGFAGIRCESAKHGGINLVVFDAAAPIVPVGNPEKMRLHDPARDPFATPLSPADLDALLL